MHRDRPAVFADAATVLDLLFKRLRHVVAQVVETKLGVGAVGDVGGVGGELLFRVLHVLQHAPAKAEPVIDRTHPLGVSAREVIVDGDEVDSLV
uniref:Unannotated protein n=1 Tax=freshwater metagenome TaxID=449393 RepID=A0A6J6A2Y0_9ZZZZ